MFVDNALLAVILLGFGLGVFTVVVELLSWRSSQAAMLKAAVDLKATYNRTAKRTKLFKTWPRRTSIP
jgi:hypothetical protein